MPFCEKGSANKLVGSFTEEDAWRFLHDVTARLAYLYDQDPPIIHQDIKPDNVLKDHLGNYQITDFGISIKARNTLRKSMLSISNKSGGGTMAYMPPECFGIEKTPIEASDIWAVGATMYELLCGDLPFGKHGGLMQKSGAEIPNIPDADKWSSDLKEIIMRCLSKETWKRQLAQQIVEWTEKHARGEKIDFSEKKPAPLNVKKIGIIAGGALLLLVVAIGLVFVLKSGKSNNNPTPVVAITEKPEPVIDTPVTTDSEPEIIQPPEPVVNTAWIAEYERLIDRAVIYISVHNYTQARVQYTQAMELAKQNDDSQKVAYLNMQIAECTRQINVTNQKQIADRLAQYQFSNGTFPLGNFMVVQRHSDNKWGIIDKSGVEKEPFIYLQSAVLKEGRYALRNEQGWTVFDASLKKLATNEANLDAFQ